MPAPPSGNYWRLWNWRSGRSVVLRVTAQACELYRAADGAVRVRLWRESHRLDDALRRPGPRVTRRRSSSSLFLGWLQLMALGVIGGRWGEEVHRVSGSAALSGRGLLAARPIAAIVTTTNCHANNPRAPARRGPAGAGNSDLTGRVQTRKRTLVPRWNGYGPRAAGT